MHRLSLIMLACCGLAACSGEAPFIETHPINIGKSKSVAICHDQDATQEAIDARAVEACGRIDRIPERAGTERYQCRLLAPHRTWYRCLDKPKT